MTHETYDPLPDILAFHDYVYPWKESSRTPLNPEKITSGYFCGGIHGIEAVLMELARNESANQCLIAALDEGSDFPLYILELTESDTFRGPIVAYENLNDFLLDQNLPIPDKRTEPNQPGEGTA